MLDVKPAKGKGSVKAKPAKPEIGAGIPAS